MTVCLETGRATFCRKGRSRIQSSRKGRDQRWKKSEIVVAEVEAFPVRGHGRLYAN